ncbi:MAG: PDZ domain-containing protein [Ruminococcus sp.]|nr:PDZ domain-containing protein [Ruminococcus sp.]
MIAVDNTEVTSVSDLKAILSEHAVGDTLSFELERDGRTGTIDLTLEEYSPAATA